MAQLIIDATSAASIHATTAGARKSTLLSCREVELFNGPFIDPSQISKHTSILPSCIEDQEYHVTDDEDPGRLISGVVINQTSVLFLWRGIFKMYFEFKLLTH